VKISLNWLKRYVDIEETPEELSHALTLLGFEVDDIENTGLAPMENVVVGEVLERDQHPDADRLGVCQVDVGSGESQQIVCGALNYKVGDRVPVALPGAVLPGGFKIKKSKLRGVESNGMMCSGKEIGVGEDHAGLLILENRPEVGAPINDVITDSDTILTLEVTPNRPDCLSHIGIAREIAAWFKRELKYPDIGDIPISEESPDEVFSGVAIDCEADCPQYIARVIRGVKVGPSPKWMQELLQSVGLRPINNVVDVTNFVMLEQGNPMHAFDARDLAGGKIMVRNATEDEVLKTLDGEERKLPNRAIVIADDERGVAIAGVMGGENSEVKADTVDLVLEVAYFKPTTIRWVSKKLALSTDSSYRFERGIDPQSLVFAAERAAQLICETAGGRLASKSYVAGSRLKVESEVKVSTDWIRAKAGWEISDDQIKESLELLELAVSDDDEGNFTVSIPSRRSDLERPVDILEEVLRMYGTDKIPAAPVVSTAVTRRDHPITEFVRASSSYLAGQHFNEAVTYTLRSGSEQSSWSDEASAMDLSLKNPISEDQTQLRHSLLPGLLETLRLNQARGAGATRFFETGHTFREIQGKVHEMISVAFVECSAGAPRTWRERGHDDFFIAKKRIETLSSLAGMDISRFKIEAVSDEGSAWQAGHAAVIEQIKAGVSAGIGLMNLARTKEMDIQGEVIAGIFSILPERLREPKRPSFKSFSLFPSTARDIALVVDKNEFAADVVRAVTKIGEKATKGVFTLESVDVFDVYEGIGVPGDKKSVAVSMMFRSMDKTLRDKEVNKVFDAIQSEIREKTTYQIRD